MNNEYVDFSYPEGFEEAAELLDFLPEESRKEYLAMLVASTLYL